MIKPAIKLIAASCESRALFLTGKKFITVNSDSNLNLVYNAQGGNALTVGEDAGGEVAAEFTGEIIDNAKIEKAKEQCKNVLIHDLRTLINPVFKWFSVLVIVITIICCFMLTKIAFTLAEQWVKNDEWLKLQEEFEQTMREVDSTEYYGIDTNSFDVSVTTVPILPFRTWATEEEYLAFAEQHKLVVDLNDMTGGKGIDVDAIAAKNRRDMEAGIFPDIEVNVDAYITTKEEFDKNEGIKPKIKKSGIAKVGSGVTKSTMPKSTLNIRRKS